jgi:acetyltransferase-like isoleucine patch superfamily enzyme
MLKKIIQKILLYYRIKRLKKNVANIPYGFLCGKYTRIIIDHGSRSEDINLNDFCAIFGKLHSCNHGIIKIGKHVLLNSTSEIRSVNKVIVGDYTMIAKHVVISDNNTHPVHPSDRLCIMKTPVGSKERSWLYSDNAPIVIGNNCWIGENSRICKGVTIGDGAIVAANSVVTKDVPINSIVAGNPAQIVKRDIDKKANRYF